MVHVEGTLVIDRPPDVVFRTVADSRQEPRYNPEIAGSTKLTDGPVGPGTRFLSVTRARRRPMEMLIELTDYDPPHRFASRILWLGREITGCVTLEPVPGGTRMRWQWDLEDHGLLRLLSPLTGRVARRHEERVWDGMRRYLESR